MLRGRKDVTPNFTHVDVTETPSRIFNGMWVMFVGRLGFTAFFCTDFHYWRFLFVVIVLDPVSAAYVIVVLTINLYILPFISSMPYVC